MYNFQSKVKAKHELEFYYEKYYKEMEEKESTSFFFLQISSIQCF